MANHGTKLGVETLTPRHRSSNVACSAFCCFSSLRVEFLLKTDSGYPNLIESRGFIFFLFFFLMRRCLVRVRVKNGREETEVLQGTSGRVHKGHFHIPGGMVVCWGVMQSICQPALHMSQRSIFSFLVSFFCFFWRLPRIFPATHQRFGAKSFSCAQLRFCIWGAQQLRTGCLSILMFLAPLAEVTP